MTLPMMIVYIIAISVAVIVIGAAMSYRRRGEPIGTTLTTLVAVMLYVTGMTLGFFASHFSSPTLEDWWQALAVRAVWQVGGALFLGVMILVEAHSASVLRKPGVWIWVAIFTATGALACLNPLRDLIEGPVELRGAAQLDVVRRSRVKGGQSIRAHLRIIAAETAHEIDMTGWPATKTEEILSGCRDTSDVEITMLQHMERVLQVRCR